MNQFWKRKAGHFLPGNNLTVFPQWERKAQPVYQRAEVSVPGRLHFSVFDFQQMAPGFGGGGIGVSTSTVGHQVVVARTSPGAGGSDVPSGRHMLELFKRTVGYERDDISVTRPRAIQHKHSGFGSNVSYNTAAMAGLNALFGSPLSPADMWEMITRNYVENTKDDKQVYFGLETGVGEACLFFGGLVWIDEKHGNGRFLGNLTSDRLWVTTAVGNYDTLATDALKAHGAGADMSDTTEAGFVPTHFMEWQKRYGDDWRAFIEGKLRPALYRNDLFAFLKLGWELNSLSNMKVLEGIFRTDVMRDYDETMQREGALYAGMSSAGPGFYAFSDSEDAGRRIADIMKTRFSKHMSGVAVARAGEKLSIDVKA
jgi:predicted sugar kinase